MAIKTYKAEAEAAASFLRKQVTEMVPLMQTERVTYEMTRTGDIASLLISMQGEIERLQALIALVTEG